MNQDALHEVTRAAVIQLLAEGKKPSWRAVREITGTGSSTDITRRIGIVMAELAENSLHGDYPEEVQTAFMHLWRAAKVAAGAEFEVSRQEHVLRTTEAEAMRDGYRNQLHETQRTLTQRLEQMTEQTQTIRSLESVIASNQENRRHLEEQVVRLETEVKALHERLESSRVAHQEALAAAATQSQQKIADVAALHEIQVEGLKQTLEVERERYDTDTAKLLQKVDAAQLEAKQERAEQKVALAAANKLIDTLRDQLAEARASEAHLAGRQESLELDIKSARGALESHEQLNAQLNRRIQQLEQRTGELRGQLTAGATLLEEERERSSVLAAELKAVRASMAASSTEPKE